MLLRCPPMSEDLCAIGGDQARVTERMVAMDDQVRIRVLEWSPAGPEQAPPVIFVAGWVSVVEGWAPLLRVLVPTRKLWYLETREKRSAEVPRRRLQVEHFTLPRFAADLVGVCRQLEIDTHQALVAGSSMGANTILEALKGDRLRARAAFLVGPNSTFAFPWWSFLLLHAPAASYHLLKYFVLWYLRHFRIDVEREPEQMRRYQRTLQAAHPLRLKLSARAVAGYTVWAGLESITTPVAIAYAASDTLHVAQEVNRIVERIPRARAVTCPSNHYMHSAEVAEDMERVVNEMG